MGIMNKFDSVFLQMKTSLRRRTQQLLSSTNAMASHLRERKGLLSARTAVESAGYPGVQEEVRRQAARAEALVRTAARLNAQLDHDTIIRMICEETRNALGSDSASVSLYDAIHDRYYHAADVGLPPSYKQLVQTV